MAGLVLLLAMASPAARAATFMTPAEALSQAFPGARIERRPLFLTPDQQRAVGRRARARVLSRLVTCHAAWRGDTLIGVGFLETRVVRTMPAVLLVAVAPDTTVMRIDVLAFHEPPDYNPPPRWLRLFAGRRLPELQRRAGIRNLAGATLSAHAFGESARVALALYALVVAPELGGR